MAITLFTGKPGCGKSYRLVYDLLHKWCEKYYVFHNIDGLNPEYFCDGKYIAGWSSIPGFLTLDKQKEICSYIQDTFKKPVLVIIDEAQSNGFNKSNSVLLDWLSYHRHMGEDIILATQSRNSIHRDYTDRCQFEVRGKRGFHTQQFLYQYMNENEVWKTDRLKKSKAVFAAYRSFDIAETKKKGSSYPMYIAIMVGLCIFMTVYLFAFGVPHMFDKAGGVKTAQAATPPPQAKPAPKPPPPKVEIHQVVKDPIQDDLKALSYAGCVNGRVMVQNVVGGVVEGLDCHIQEYQVLSFSRGACRVLDTVTGKIYELSRKRITGIPRERGGYQAESETGLESLGKPKQR